MSESFKINITFEITKENVGNLLTTALEGGSNYWYFIDEIIRPFDFKKVFHRNDYPLYKGGAFIMSTDDGELKKFRLDLDSIEKGLATMALKYPVHFADFRRECYDATTGDVFLQCCCFGETIYC